jgi:hypothetical protein
MSEPKEPVKRLVVHDPHDYNKWISLDIPNAQVWELEPRDSDWDGLEGFFTRTTLRTLYRLPDNRWVLVEQTEHYDFGSLGDPTYEVLTDGQAAEQILLSGLTPPAELVHFVSDKLNPPPPQPLPDEPQTYGEEIVDGDVAIVLPADPRPLSQEALDALSPPSVDRFGPVRDEYSGNETTLFRYPGDKWFLFTDPSYKAAGTRSESLTPAQAAEWFLNNGREAPPSLFAYLPPPRQATGDNATAPESYGPVGEPTDFDHDGVPTFHTEETLFRYPENRWVMVWKRTHVESDIVHNKGHKPVSAAEAADWILNHGLHLPESLYAHLPSPPEAGLPLSTLARQQSAEQTERSTAAIDSEARAIGFLAAHPEWTDKKIADTVGVSRTTLYSPSWSRFQAARAALKSGKQEKPKGSRDADGNLEAYA